jgi:hypothetical protein
MERPRPFPQIPDGCFPGDTTERILPTHETTTLGDRRRVKLASLISKGTDNLQKAAGEINRFVSSDYPRSYGVFTEVSSGILSTHAIRRPGNEQRRSNLQDLQRLVRDECEPIQNFHLQCLFEAHDYRTEKERENHTQRLEQLMRKTFVPGQRNIFFHEISGGRISMKYLQEGVDKYKTHARAYVYAQVHDNKNMVFTEQSLDAMLRQLEESFDPKNLYSSGMAYQLTFLKLIDTFNEEGYNISMVLEGKTKVPKKKPTRNLEEYIIDTQEDGNWHRQRNLLVVSQIGQLAKEARSHAAQTNVLLVFGSAHRGLVEHIPNVAKMHLGIDEYDIPTSLHDDLRISIMEGKSVDEESFKASWKEFSDKYNRFR